MKRRTTIIGILVLLVLAWFAYREFHQSQLARYRDVIESRFQAELTLIERESLDFPDEYDDANYDLVEQNRAMFDAALADPAIYWATWSTDGHHGLMGLKSMDRTGGGLTWGQWHVAESDDGSHSLRYGTSYDGDRLLVYTGYNPDASKRHYMVAFLRNSIDEFNHRPWRTGRPTLFLRWGPRHTFHVWRHGLALVKFS